MVRRYEHDPILTQEHFPPEAGIKTVFMRSALRLSARRGAAKDVQLLKYHARANQGIRSELDLSVCRDFWREDLEMRSRDQEMFFEVYKRLKTKLGYPWTKMDLSSSKWAKPRPLLTSCLCFCSS